MATKDQPAFPSVSPTDKEVVTRTGMTLRDWFAGQVLASGTIQKPYNMTQLGQQGTRRAISEACYAVADALMEARGEPK